MNFSADDHRFMALALQLAARGLYTTDPNPRVGCVLVNDGDLVGEGWHERAGEAHAEVHALRAAGERSVGATAYVTLEPCSHHGRTGPCAEALIKAGVARVVCAMVDPNPRVSGSGLRKLHAAGIVAESGLLQAQAEALNPGFIKRMTLGLPLVRLKLAMSLDGRTAMASGESKWITGAAARRDVQRLRARSSAILTGVGTVLADDPSLTVRAEDLGGPVLRQPLRVIVDRQGRIPATAKVLHGPGEHLVSASALPELLRELAARGCNEVLVEAGAVLSGALMAASLVDELIVYIAPKLMGDNARALLSLPGIDQLGEALALDLIDVRQFGADVRLRYRPVKKVEIA